MFKLVFVNSLLMLLLMSAIRPLHGQQTFNGSFLMTFTLSEPITDNPPMLWNIESAANGGRMAMELQDDMIKKGVSKRVLFNPKDSTWTMLMSFNNVKQGARIHRADMFREKKGSAKFSVTTAQTKRIIEGYHCVKVITESKNYRAEIWITKELKFDVCRIYKLLNHCSMINDIVRKGDWFNSNLYGMILEVTSTNKSTGQSYSMSISSLKLNEITSSLFTTKDFRISDIPEGQNCGIALDEK